MAENFKIDLNKLKKTNKNIQPKDLKKSDEIAEEHGFIVREAPKKRGRKPSPRTGQVHARVYPNVSSEISEESQRRGVQQGVLIEEAWELYKKKNNI